MPPLLSPSPTILVPHLPPKTLVGIDLITFTSTANFHGIRDLPEGWHFLYTGTTESLSLRCGGWFYVGDISTAGTGTSNDQAIVPATRADQGPEVIIWKWNTDTESLSPLNRDSDADRQEAMRHKANLGAVWQSGGLFRYRSRVPLSLLDKQIPIQDEIDEEDEEEGREDWKGLTNWLSPSILSRIVGDPTWDVDGRPRWMVTSAGTANRDSEEIPGLTAFAETSIELGEVSGEQETEYSFLPVDLKRTWREGAIGRERTEAAQDRSWALGDIISRYSSTSSDDGSGEAQILGELQFTFLMALTLMNYSCLQQWKRLLGLILTCRSAIKEKESFIRDVLRLLLVQLKRCDDVDGGLFEIDGDEGGAFLRKLLTKFRISVNEVVGEGTSMAKSEFEKLEAWTKEEFDWELDHNAVVRKGMIQLEDGEEVEMEMNDDEDDETGEYAPMVVDIGDTA